MKTAQDRTISASSDELSRSTRRLFAHEVVGAAPKLRRKFAVEPVETTQKRHRKVAPEANGATVKQDLDNNAPGAAASVRRRFRPEPVETIVRSSRKEDKDEPRSVKPTRESKEDVVPKPRRRFAPQLIETAKRSRKAGDSPLPFDKMETIAEGSRTPRRGRHLVPAPPENTPMCELSRNPIFLEMKQAAALSFSRNSSRGSTRSQHSFRIPELDPIESSQSEESTPPSLSTSPSAFSDTSYMYKEATRMRESVDDRFSGYMLELAARAAEKQLREQAMAAFPNNDFHEPVHHFVDSELDEPETDSEGVRVSFSRRESTFSEATWELAAMQKHRERREQDAELEKKNKREAEMNKKQNGGHGVWRNPAADLLDGSSNKNVMGGWQKDEELDKMRKGARPPMLGADIEFPRCSSPDPARFDTTQGCDAARKAMCYLTEQCQLAEKGGGLWCGKETTNLPSRPSQTPSQSQSRRASGLWFNAGSRPPSRGGLWGGCCVNSGPAQSRKPTGLMTPSLETENPLDTPHPTPQRSQLPLTPPESDPDMNCIDEKLAKELAIEEEFGDDFVTQVYNYLSLGYPSIARNFDEELSKISHIPVCELRQDDHLASSRGYIRLGPDGNLKETEITEENCMRWRALRSYIQEWARQQPSMAVKHNVSVGMIVRKGSWAF
ncbi:hypothetical protein GQ43DRAFT_469305 [Delitschia confertaspora ATCC 74209]|uniref:Uncharacterized protein n=1 Tax=Delitschia confertaspora ATCC 74209 TaxID=1513339 RepID=A0A9P4MSI4_9PLEO|nr:hypothetical protein GQ43DRAFT_469305 [Delitschia confertaspora ATCC 74209]